MGRIGNHPALFLFLRRPVRALAGQAVVRLEECESVNSEKEEKGGGFKISKFILPKRARRKAPCQMDSCFRRNDK
jgi:hypothetical protein